MYFLNVNWYLGEIYLEIWGNDLTVNLVEEKV